MFNSHSPLSSTRYYGNTRAEKKTTEHNVCTAVPPKALVFKGEGGGVGGGGGRGDEHKNIEPFAPTSVNHNLSQTGVPILHSAIPNELIAISIRKARNGVSGQGGGKRGGEQKNGLEEETETIQS